jgi:choline dehydrogenase-like flavoprotein
VRDVIVIGAGGGGAVVAKELAERGLDVLVLEAGPHYDDPEAVWSKLENDANNVTDGYFRFGPGDRSKPWWFRETPQNSLIWQLAGVGGTTQHYYGNCPRAVPGTFMGYEGADKAAYDSAHPFPFSYESLVPYFEWVEFTLPVQTAAMGTKEERFFRGAEAMGLAHQTSKDTTGDSYRAQENAILQPGGTAGRTRDPAQLVFPQATGCTFCGYCFSGCTQPTNAPRNLKAKRSTDNSYFPMALTASTWREGGHDVTLVADAFVTRVLSTTEGSTVRARGVRWRDTNTGAVTEEEATVVVMAGGCTEDPRLWKNSGLPDPNGWVGKGYTDHFFDWVVGRFDEYTGSSKGVGSSARADFPGRGGLENVGLGPALQAFSSQFSDAGIRGLYGNGLARTGAWDGDSGRLGGDEMKAILSDVDKLLNVLVITDDDVEETNYVGLSGLPGDEHGPIPKVVFDHRNRSARTLANREFLANKAAELLRAAGAKEVYRIDWPPLILHVQSTMRMGHSADDSVVDEGGEARFVRGLFIGDNAALANGLGGPNPTLTSQALATRTAEHIFTRYFDGDPWVLSDTPISSIDDRVTAAVLGTAARGPAPAPVPVAPPSAAGGSRLPATGGGGAPLVGAAALAAAAAVRAGTRRLDGHRPDCPTEDEG